MIKASIVGLCSNIKHYIVGIPDIHNGPKYASHTLSCINAAILSADGTNDDPVTRGEHLRIWSGNDYTLQCFSEPMLPPGSGYLVHKPEHRVGISATKVRVMMQTQCPWDVFVPAPVAAYINTPEVNGAERVMRLLGKPRRNPTPTADVIIERPLPDGRTGIVLIKRKNRPFGWAMPGGFVDYGEDVWDAAVREVKEETSLVCKRITLLSVYGRPDRDERFHTQTTVFYARAEDVEGELLGADDAAEAGVFPEDGLPELIAFDHRNIIEDYFALKKAPNSLLAFSKKY